MALRSKLIRLAFEQPKLRPHLLPLLKTAGVGDLSPTLNSKEKRLINRALVQAGFGGAKKFPTIGSALNAAAGVTGNFGLEWAKMVSSWEVSGLNGFISIPMAKTNQEDAYSPLPIRNSYLVFSWTTLEKDRIEVIAYMS